MAASLKKHIAALKALKGRKVEAGWFESDKYPAEDGEEPMSVARNARIHEYGATVTIKARKVTINRSINLKTGEFKKGGKFVGSDKANFQTTHDAPDYTIVIPARPAMRLAWSNFNRDRVSIQTKVGGKLVRGEITPEQALGQIGLALEGYIAKSIRNGPWVPNAPKTVARKGFNKPLIDTGHMWKTVSSKVS